MTPRFSNIAFVLALVTASAASAAADDPARTIAIGAATQLEQRYVYPMKAKAAADVLRARAAAGAYDGKTGEALAATLTADIAPILHDKHVRVGYSQDVLPPDTASGDEPSAAEVAQNTSFERSIGFGVERSMHLDANVGYIDLRIFAQTRPQRDRVIDGLADSVAYSDAVILDLRQNHGGDPAAVARLLSHFFPAGTHLNDFVGRGDGDAKITASTFTGKVNGPQITAPLYVLTSSHTFSGGEECAYDIQALKRGTLVGEKTGGGANPGSAHRLADHFGIFVPDARARNPITHTNWEGTGVQPDVAVAADRALVTAYGMALAAKLADPKLAADDREDLRHLRDGLSTSDDAALLTEPSDHVNSATAATNEDPAITALVRTFFAGLQSGNVDRSTLSASFSAFLTQSVIDGSRTELADSGPAALIFRGKSSTPTGNAFLYDAKFSAAPLLHLTIVLDASGKINMFEFEH